MHNVVDWRDQLKKIVAKLPLIAWEKSFGRKSKAGKSFTNHDSESALNKENFLLTLSLVVEIEFELCKNEWRRYASSKSFINISFSWNYRRAFLFKAPSQNFH